MSQAASAITGTTAMTASCQADNAEFGSWVTSFRIGQTVAHRHDPLDVPCLGHDVAAAGRGLRVTLEGNDAAGDGYGEPVRMGGESFEITFFVISWRISSSGRL